MKSRQISEHIGVNESSEFERTWRQRAVSFLERKVHLIYFVAVSVAILITAILYKCTVLPLEASRGYEKLVPRFPYAYEQVTDHAALYPDFSGYDMFSCKDLRFKSEVVQSEITLHFSKEYKHFEFTVTRGQLVNLSLTSPLNETDLRKSFVIQMDEQFIGDVTQLMCESDICKFSLSSVEQQKHDVLLRATTFNIETANCEQIAPYTVQHMFARKYDYDNYYMSAKKGSYIVMVMRQQETIWGMQTGNSFEVYRTVKNDLGLSFMTLGICFLSIVAVIGGVGHASLRAVEENEN